MFVDEHYEKVEKVYSIWICPDPVKKRKNGIFKYHTIEDVIYGETYTKEEKILFWSEVEQMPVPLLTA